MGKLTPPELLHHIYAIPPPKTPTTILYDQWLHSARPILCISIDPTAVQGLSPHPSNSQPKWTRVSGENRIPSILCPSVPVPAQGPAVGLGAIRFGVQYTTENLPYILVNFGKQEGDTQLLWHGLAAVELLPNVLKAEIARYVPDPECHKHAFTWFLWVMRVLAPALISRATVRDDPNWMKQRNMSIVHSCAIRAQYIISRYLAGTLTALETQAHGAVDLCPTHWHSTFYARYIHPLGEPWIQDKTDPDLNPTYPIQQRPTVCQRLWGAKSKVPALLADLLGRFQSKTNRTRVAWVKAMWEGPWAGPDAHDPYRRMLQWLYDNPSKITMFYYMPKSINHYWPIPEDNVPAPMESHTLLLAALAAIAALSVLEHQCCHKEPDIAFAARVAKASFLPLLTDHRVRGMADKDTDWLSNEWFSGNEMDGNKRFIHLVWPEPAGVMTYNELPNHQNVLLKLRMAGLDQSETSRLETVMEKVTPFRSGARSLGSILTKLYNDPPCPRIREDAKEKTKDRIIRQWKEDCQRAHTFRLLFNQLTWITTQGLYARAMPQADWTNAVNCHVAISKCGQKGVVKWLASSGKPDKEWHMLPMAILREYLCALFDANSWFTEAQQDKFDFERFSASVRAICNSLRSNFSSVAGAVDAILHFKNNTPDKLVYRHSHKPVQDTIRKEVLNIVTSAQLLYFSIRVDILPRLRDMASTDAAAQAKALVDKISRSNTSNKDSLLARLGVVICADGDDIAADNAMATLKAKIAIRGPPSHGPEKEVADVERAMAAANKSLGFGHAASLWRFMSHLRPDEMSERLRTWCTTHIQAAFPGLTGRALSERVFKWSKPTKDGEDKPSRDMQIAIVPSDVKWLKVDLCALSVHLIWSLSGQCSSNIYHFLARLPPKDRSLVAPLTLPELGGIEEKTAVMIQCVVLSDPVILLPKAMRLKFGPVSLWDARVLYWWILHNETLNSITLAPRSIAEMDSIRNVAWKEFSRLYGPEVGTRIVRNGGLLSTVHTTPPEPSLPIEHWTVYHLPCCGKICSKLKVDRLVYDRDIGCMVCRNGLPRKHSAGPASTDRTKSYIVVDAMNHDYKEKERIRYAHYRAEEEKADCARVAREYAALVSIGYGDGTVRLRGMAADYTKEIVACVMVRRDQIQEEKLGGTEHGSHRTARVLTALAGELRAFATGDASYCVPFANEHANVMQTPAIAAFMGFWWAAEHQIVKTTGRQVVTTPSQQDAFWAMVIEDPNYFVDPELREIFETMNPNMRIGGTGITAKKSPFEIVPNPELFRVVRSGPKNQFGVPCVTVPARGIFVRGFRLVYGHPGKKAIKVYGHCICCGQWSANAEAGFLAGARVCLSCQPKDDKHHRCAAPLCDNHDTGKTHLRRLVVRQDAGLDFSSMSPEPVDVFTAHTDLPAAFPAIWIETWWCPIHYYRGKVAQWAQYFASMEFICSKLQLKANKRKTCQRNRY